MQARASKLDRIKTEDPLPERPGGPTQASDVHDRLHRDLLEGRLEPGSKLALRVLTERYGVGQTPLREALNRLAARGLVEARDQRGFFAAPISRDELEELTRTRCWVEEIALRQAVLSADTASDERLVLTAHRLERTPRSLKEDAFQDNPAWDDAHRAFHRALLAPCRSRPLRGFCDDLADQMHRYRQRAVQRSFPRRNIKREHRSIVDAVLDRDADLAAGRLVAHYNATASFVLESLA